ncbi:MAG TPA: ATP-binding protein [Longimicrobiales bacterium]|nr:ATP-binding protein [Longimicrobiales bacterium]
MADEHFTDRSREVAVAQRAMLRCGRLLLTGERRVGKSSILRQATLHATGRGATVVALDLWTVSSLEEVVRRVVSAVPWAWAWRERLQRLWLDLGLTLGVTSDPTGAPIFTLTGTPGELRGGRAREMFLHLLARLDVVAGESGAPVALVLDEFQRIEEVDRGAGALLRSAAQESHHLAFVCAGSTLSLVRELVGPEGPLHGIFDELAVGPIEPALLAAWIEDRLRSHGVEPAAGTGARVVAWAGQRTEDILRLAREVWDGGIAGGAVSPADVPAALGRIVSDRRSTYERIWVDLAPSQRGVLRALADGAVHLTARDTIQSYALPTPAGVLKALGRLQVQHLVNARGDAISDPFLAEWVLRYAMPDGRSRSEFDRGSPEG